MGILDSNIQNDTPPHLTCGGVSLSKKPCRVCRRWRQIESNLFSAGACTWQKTLLRLQVWNLFPIGGQIMRAADCKPLSEKPKGVFRQSHTTTSNMWWCKTDSAITYRKLTAGIPGIPPIRLSKNDPLCTVFSSSPYSGFSASFG